MNISYAPGVVLGERKDSKPGGVPHVRPMEVINFVLAALRGTPELEAIRARVDSDEGRPRRLQVDVLIAAAIADVIGTQSNMHVRSIASLLRSLPVGDQRVLGVRWVDPNRGGEKLITERQVAYLFERIAYAFDAEMVPHNHWFVQDEQVWTVDGEFVCPETEFPATDRDTLNCGPTCPKRESGQSIGNWLLDLLWKYTGIPESSQFAIDSAVVPTHYLTYGYGSRADIDPDWVAEDDKPSVGLNVLQVRQDKRNKQTTQETMEAARKFRDEAPTPPPRDAKSRKPEPAGPVVPGDFTRFSSDFPQLGEDMRLAWTKDTGARTAYRGAGNGRRGGILNGRDSHAFISSGFLPDGSPYPPFARAYEAVSGGDDKARAALNVLDTAVAGGVTPTNVSLDRIYTSTIPERFEHLVTERGWNLTRDLKNVQRNAEQWMPGVTFLDGAWFTTGMPGGLIDLPRPAMNASNAQRKECQDRFDARRPYTFRVHGKTKNGDLRMRGPAVPDHVTRDKNGKVIAVRGMRVRCANSPYVHLVSRVDVPAMTTCKAGKPCACSSTFTVAANEIPNSYEPLLWGSSKWAKAYYRRNMSEAHFSMLSYHYRLERHSIRVQARKWDLAFAMIMTASFVRQFHSYVHRLGAWALDPGYHSALSPNVFTAALARVLTPSKRQREQVPPDEGPSGG